MNKYKRFNVVSFFLVLLAISWVRPCFSLEPEEILVVANRRMAGSIDLARYYMDRRSIPRTNFLSLSLTLSETMTREEYDHTLKKKVLDSLNTLQAKNRIEAIVPCRQCRVCKFKREQSAALVSENAGKGCRSDRWSGV